MKEKDSDILRGIIAGDETSFKQLFDDYYVTLAVFGSKYVSDLETAREIVQDFFVHLYEIRDSLQISTSLKSYLYQSARNRCLNYIKHQNIQKKHLENMIFFDETESEIEEKIFETELELRIFQIISDLPAQCQRIFKMSRMEGIKNKDIAEKLNISIRTVETQISKALKILRNKLSNIM